MASRTNRGRDLERRVARVEFAEGAFVRTEVRVADPVGSPGRDVLTDLDVLAIEFDMRLREHSSAFECKSRRGQAQEAERLFWLAGLQEFVGVDRATLARPSVSGRGRAIARRLGIETLDEATLTRREAENAWIPPSFAHVGGNACAELEAEAAAQIKAIGEFPPELTLFLWHDGLRAPAHLVLGKLTQARAIAEHLAVLPPAAGLTVAAQAVIDLSLSALRVGSWLDAIPATEIARMIAAGYTTGEMHSPHLLRVLESAEAYFNEQLEVVHRAYAEAGAKRASVELEVLTEQLREPPPWLDVFVDLAQRYRAIAPISRSIPQTLELALFDALPGDSNWLASAFDHLFTIEHKQLVNVTLKAFDAVAGEALGDHVRAVLDLPFDRVPPPLPDRRTAYAVVATEPSSEGRLFDAESESPQS